MKTHKRTYELIRGSLIRKLPSFALMIFGCMVVVLTSANMTNAQCQYDWQAEALPFISQTPSSEINMDNRMKIDIGRSCQKIVDSMLRNVQRPTQQPAAQCAEIVPRGRQAGALKGARYTKYYQAFRHPRSMRDNDMQAMRIWYQMLDCPVRQAIRMLEKKRVAIPHGLIIYRIPKPSGRYQNPTVISRVDGFEPAASIFFTEQDFGFNRYSQDLSFPGVVLSHIGEIWHERRGGEFYYTLSRTRPRTGREVSPRASDSAYAFVGDVFAGWVAGKNYSPNVWDEYRSFRGPVFRGMPRP